MLRLRTYLPLVLALNGPWNALYDVLGHITQFNHVFVLVFAQTANFFISSAFSCFSFCFLSLCIQRSRKVEAGHLEGVSVLSKQFFVMLSGRKGHFLEALVFLSRLVELTCHFGKVTGQKTGGAIAGVDLGMMVSGSKNKCV